MLHFELLATEGRARRGRLTLHHGVIDTPIFICLLYTSDAADEL